MPPRLVDMVIGARAKLAAGLAAAGPVDVAERVALVMARRGPTPALACQAPPGHSVGVTHRHRPLALRAPQRT